MHGWPADEMCFSRRLFVAGCAGAAAAAGNGPAGEAADVATIAPADTLADYVATRDASTATVPLGGGAALGGRWQTCRLTSQTWKGCLWTHELSIFLPAEARDTRRMLLWIDGGNDKKVPRDQITEPTDAVKTLAAVATAAGLPAAVVRQVPFQPMFGDLHEDGLIAHSFVEYAKTGDPTWPLLLPMVKSAVEGMNAASSQAREHWGVEIAEFVVTGASKRGWTTWLSAAVDDRVKGIVPMVIDMLSLADHVKLQHASFGKMSELLVDYTSRGIERLLVTERGRDLLQIVDPYSYRDRYTMPKVIALGTNDPYWPLEACSLYYDGLPGPRWLSYCPNAGHGLPVSRVAGLVAAVGRHVAGLEALPQIDWTFENAAADTQAFAAECVVRCAATPARVTLWTAASPGRDFRKARWSSQAVQAAGPEWRVPIPAPQEGSTAGLVELEFAREPVPLVLTSGVNVLRAS
ncbi:MAG: PhoPQ-activated pathogenicity-related family protein [Planctomycetia bacterium]|nr:PhoPQ-activated pathogenicity-related family protein [Planctomycetia bacterium]